MRQPVSDSDESGNPGFQKIMDGFLLQPGLPFATVVTAEKINCIFARHGGLFGGNGIYSSAIVLWAFLGQVLRDGKEASCQSAVAGIISFCLQVGRDAPTADTGDYCRARAKLSEPALRELSREVANDAEQQVDEAWLWKGRHAVQTETAHDQFHEYLSIRSLRLGRACERADVAGGVAGRNAMNF